MSNGSYTRESGEKTVTEGAADAIVYGRPYIANPDLVERFAKQTPLNDVNYDRLYGGGPDGYSDYPVLAGDTPAHPITSGLCNDIPYSQRWRARGKEPPD